MSFDLTQLLQGLASAEQNIVRTCVTGVEQFAEQVLADSQELCPVSPVDKNHPLYNGHSGALRDSAVVKDAVVEGGTITVEEGYNTSYAAAVHERIDLNHQYPGAVNPKAQSKFLETALRNNQPRLVPFIGDLLKQVLRG